MEQVYKKTGILFKILPCMLIAMYVVMCLFGASVFATDTENESVLSFDNKTSTFSYQSVSYQLPGDVANMKYKLIFHKEGFLYMCVSESPFNLKTFNSDGSEWFSFSGDSPLYTCYFSNSSDRPLTEALTKASKTSLSSYEIYENRFF